MTTKQIAHFARLGIEDEDEDDERCQNNAIPNERPERVTPHKSNHEVNGTETDSERGHGPEDHSSPCDWRVRDDKFNELLHTRTEDDGY